MSYAANEQAIIETRLDYLKAAAQAKKPHVMDGHDHTACANKQRKAGFWHSGMEYVNGRLVPKDTWIEDRSSTECQYDRRRVDPACARANCPRIGL